jgi:hypothetical protein
MSPTTDKTAEFNENINITSESLNGQSYTLSEYLDASLVNLKTAIKDMTMLADESKKINGTDYRIITFTGKYETSTLKWKQYFTIIDGVAYIITLTGIDDESFVPYEKTVATVAESFAVIQ